MIDKLKNITKNINKYLFLHLKNKWIKRFKINKDDYYIVSLGWNCLSRSLPTEWGLKKRKEEGETSDPFDLSMHDVKFIYDIIAGNFSSYYDDTVRVDENLWHNKTYNIYYNHDSDCNDKDEFILRYKNRINNFQKKLSSSKPIIFIYNTRDDHSDRDEDIQKLKELIWQQTDNKRKKIFLCITREKYRLKSEMADDKDIAILYAPIPYNDYIWWEAGHKHTISGYRYEKKIADKIHNLLKGMVNDR